MASEKALSTDGSGGIGRDIQNRHDNESNGEGRRLHRATLVEMNRAVFTARRDVAHARAIAVLRGNLMNSSKARRAELYSFCLRLLRDAIVASTRSQLQADSRTLHYLRLLEETVSANSALVNHEMALAREAEDIASLLDGVATSPQLEHLGDAFSKSEKNILECIEDLLQFGEPIIEKESDGRRAHFSDDEERRYALAYSELEKFYDEMFPPGGESGTAAAGE